MPRNDSFTIRQAKLHDLSALQKIASDTYRQHFGAIWSEQGIQAFLDRDFSTQALTATLTSPVHTCLLATEESNTGEERVVGYAKANWQTPNPVTGEVGGELQKIYFAPEATGKGYGSAVFARVFALAQERGEPLWLDVLKTNVGAQRLYARQGFRVLGEVAFATDRMEIGMLVMMRPLPIADASMPA